MSDKLTAEELNQIREEAENEYLLFTIDECSGPVDMEKRNGVIYSIRKAYIAAKVEEREKVKPLLDLLKDLEDYFDNSADADYEDERPKPNVQMIILTDIRTALSNYYNKPMK